MITLQTLSGYEWGALALTALFLGMQKTGVQGVSMIAVPILAAIFGGRVSVGLVLPMYSMADIFALYYYHRDAEWKHVLRVLPATVIGITVGALFGSVISDDVFRRTIGICVFVSLAILVYREHIRKEVQIPDAWWFAPLVGLGGGFATMIGNASSPIMALYLLSMRLPKRSYIGTGAWFFFINNLIKIPFHVFLWGTISGRTLAINATVAPLILIGAMVGVRLVRRIPDGPYRIFVVVVTFLASLRLFF